MKKIQITAQIRPNIWARFKSIVDANGVSINFGLERVLIDVINAGQIPGIESVQLDEERPTSAIQGPSRPTLVDPVEEESEIKRLETRLSEALDHIRRMQIQNKPAASVSDLGTAEGETAVMGKLTETVQPPQKTQRPRKQAVPK